MPRVVSLIASATEIICAIGCRHMLVGRSHECDYPPDVTDLPVLSKPAIDVDGTSAEIDRRVREAVAGDGLSVYRVEGERLRELAPDVIVTQDHCEVCAVSLADVERAARDLVGNDVRVVALKPNRLADIWTGIREVAAALGVKDAGEAFVTRLQARMATVEAQAARAAEVRGRRQPLRDPSGPPARRDAGDPRRATPPGDAPLWPRGGWVGAVRPADDTFRGASRRTMMAVRRAVQRHGAQAAGTRPSRGTRRASSTTAAWGA